MPMASTRATRITTGLIAAIAATVATAVAVPAQASGSSTPLSRFDQRLLDDINHARAAQGLRALTPAAGTTDVAHHWTCHLASTKSLEHNGRLGSQLDSHGSRSWTTYAENVGYVGHRSGADKLFRIYMQSPEHRDNILDPSMRYVGLWSKRSGKFRFNTIDFVGSHSNAYRSSYGSERASC
jgi:uncharacterized protein YkwD